MKRSVCAFLFVVSLFQWGIAEASESSSENLSEDLRVHVLRLNEYLKAYEVSVYQALQEGNLEEGFYVGNESRDRFYFSYERVFLHKIRDFNEDSYKQIFHSANQMLTQYLSERPIKYLSVLKYLRIKMVALFLAVKCRNWNWATDITKYTVLFDLIFPNLFTPDQWRDTEADFFRVLYNL